MKHNINPQTPQIPTQREEFLSLKEYKDKDITCNWSNTNVLALKDQIRYPRTEEDLQDIVRSYTGKIRVVGSRLSYEPIASVTAEGSDAILLSLEKLQGFVSMTEDSVTFFAGSSVDSLNQFLIKHDRMLPASPGVIGIQTLAGAISTGTHGQGLRQSTLSDAVLKLRVVLPDGSLREVDNSSEDFGAFIMSLGCLGVITQVTFKTIPNQIFTCQKITTNYADLVHLYPRMNQRSRFVKAWWFSWTDEVHIWEVNEASPEEIELYKQNGGELTPVSAVDESLNNTIDDTMVKMGQDTNDASFKGKHFETVTRFKDVTNVTGNIYQVFCKGIPAPQINCEIAIPFEKVGEALKILKKWQKKSETSSLHYPFILRCTGASKAFLSPAYGKEVCYIGFLVYLAEDGSFIQGSMERMEEIQERLAKIGGIPHFGKHFVRELYDFPSLLPKWRDFISLKKKIDPNGKFENTWIKKLLTE